MTPTVVEERPRRSMHSRPPRRSNRSARLARREDAGDGRLRGRGGNRDAARAGGRHHHDAELVGHYVDQQRRAELGIAAYLTKPVYEADLLGAIDARSGRSRRRQRRLPARIEAGGLNGRGWPASRILLAEDNVVNQRVAAGLLEPAWTQGDGRPGRPRGPGEARRRDLRRRADGCADAGNGRTRRDGRHTRSASAARAITSASSP